MQRLVFTAIFMILFLSIGASAQESNESSTSAIYELTVDVDKFVPAELTINKGDAVRVVMGAGTRNVVFDNGEESGELSPGTSVLLYFDNLGTFTYQVENEAELTGTLTVVESGAPAPALSEAEILAQGGNQHFVMIQEFEYVPQNIVVAVGDTVIFEHLGTMGHSVDFFDGEGKVLNPGSTYNRTFTAEGEFGYQCRFHNAMKGIVTVVSKEEFESTYSEESQAESEVEKSTTEETAAESVDTTGLTEEEIEAKLNELKSQLEQKITSTAGAPVNVEQIQTQVQGISTTVSGIETEMQTVETSLEGLETEVSSLSQSLESLENAPAIEIPEPTSPLMMYVSLGLDLFFVIILVVLGVWMIKKGTSPKVSSGTGKVGVTDTKKKELKGLPPLPAKKGINLKGKESKPAKPLDSNQAYIKKCRASGMNDAQIVKEFVKSGWKEDKAKKIVSGNPKIPL